MCTKKETGAVAATTTPAVNNEQAVQTPNPTAPIAVPATTGPDHAGPHLLTLHPTSGTEWWSWCISIDGRPAVRFRDIEPAALALEYLLDDMENGDDITTRERIEAAVTDSVRPHEARRSFELVEGWKS